MSATRRFEEAYAQAASASLQSLQTNIQVDPNIKPDQLSDKLNPLFLGAERMRENEEKGESVQQEEESVQQDVVDTSGEARATEIPSETPTVEPEPFVGEGFRLGTGTTPPGILSRVRQGMTNLGRSVRSMLRGNVRVDPDASIEMGLLGEYPDANISQTFNESAVLDYAAYNTGGITRNAQNEGYEPPEGMSKMYWDNFLPNNQPEGEDPLNASTMTELPDDENAGANPPPEPQVQPTGSERAGNFTPEQTANINRFIDVNRHIMLRSSITEKQESDFRTKLEELGVSKSGVDTIVEKHSRIRELLNDRRDELEYNFEENSASLELARRNYGRGSQQYQQAAAAEEKALNKLQLFNESHARMLKGKFEKTGSADIDNFFGQVHQQDLGVNEGFNATSEPSASIPQVINTPQALQQIEAGRFSLAQPAEPLDLEEINLEDTSYEDFSNEIGRTPASRGLASRGRDSGLFSEMQTPQTWAKSSAAAAATERAGLFVEPETPAAATSAAAASAEETPAAADYVTPQRISRSVQEALQEEEEDGVKIPPGADETDTSSLRPSDGGEPSIAESSAFEPPETIEPTASYEPTGSSGFSGRVSGATAVGGAVLGGLSLLDAINDKSATGTAAASAGLGFGLASMKIPALGSVGIGVATALSVPGIVDAAKRHDAHGVAEQSSMAALGLATIAQPEIAPLAVLAGAGMYVEGLFTKKRREKRQREREEEAEAKRAKYTQSVKADVIQPTAFLS